MARTAHADAAVTRSRILDAALDLFAENGFHGTSMREVAAAAGLTGGSLYHHFESKEAMLRAVLLDMPQRAQLAERMARVLGSTSGPGALEDVLRGFCREVLEVFQQPFHQKMFRILMNDGQRLAREGVVPPDALASVPRAVVGHFIRALMERGLVRTMDVDYALMALMGPMLLYRQFKFVWGVPSGGLMDVEEFVEQHVRALCMLYAPRAGEGVHA